MPVEDTSTLTLGPLDTLSGSSRGLPVVPAFTIVWHPDLDRVGQMAPLTALLDSDVAHLTRDEPAFLVPGSTTGHPVDHRGMSHSPIVTVVSVRGSLELRPGTSSNEVEVDGERFDRARPLTLEDLRRGLIITVGRRFVFCLHAVHYPITRSPPLGLIGSGDAIEDVRRSITRVATQKTPVLIRGETGTGKEVVARALHETGARPGGPFIATNMTVLQAPTAAAELFGYEKGAFTGATSSSPGLFRSAHGGTLFLDEIGDTHPEVQRMLLRVLADESVQPLGNAQARKVDVRLITATDSRLEQGVAAGRFQASLYHRLNSSYKIALPPLRARREDIGVLLVHFLRERLPLRGDLQRLQHLDPKRPWLAASDVASLALAHWSGNVRELQGLATNLAPETATASNSRTHEVIASFLRLDAELAAGEAAPARGSTQPDSASGGTNTAEEGTALDRLLEALDASQWDRPRAARFLGVAPATFWRRLQRHPDLRRVADLRLPELLRQVEAAGGDVSVAATKLGVAAELLRRRLSAKR